MGPRPLEMVFFRWNNFSQFLKVDVSNSNRPTSSNMTGWAHLGTYQGNYYFHECNWKIQLVMFDWRLSKWSGQSIQHMLFLLGIGCGDEPLETPPIWSQSLVRSIARGMSTKDHFIWTLSMSKKHPVLHHFTSNGRCLLNDSFSILNFHTQFPWLVNFHHSNHRIQSHEPNRPWLPSNLIGAIDIITKCMQDKLIWLDIRYYIIWLIT